MLTAMRSCFIPPAKLQLRSLRYSHARWQKALTCANEAGADAAGFTIVEVLAALAILSLSLTLLFSTMSEGFHRQQRARAMTEASLLAQSVLARLGTEQPVKPGLTNGDLPNGYRWEVQIAPFGNSSDALEWPIAAYKVDVKVYAGPELTNPAASLTSLRLGPKDAAR
jgi:general secretion pathway protein I